MLVCFLEILLVFLFVFPYFVSPLCFPGHQKKLLKSHGWNISDLKLAGLIVLFTGSRSTDMQKILSNIFFLEQLLDLSNNWSGRNLAFYCLNE